MSIASTIKQGITETRHYLSRLLSGAPIRCVELSATTRFEVVGLRNRISNAHDGFKEFVWPEESNIWQMDVFNF
ncbi:hypothetical protein ACT29I_00935 [Saccharicrinis sp. GN24d3]